MVSGKFRQFKREAETERLLAVAAAVKCAVLVVVLCGIAWIGATPPLDEAKTLMTATQSAHAGR